MKMLYFQLVNNKLNSTYQEWWRDWPDETRQPVSIEIYGANSSRVLALGDKESI